MESEQAPQQFHLDLQLSNAAKIPITCLGMTFADEDARRAYFRERLREHLQDPAFRATEGFPLGADEEILTLSDPPYYTACPNPFLPQIVAEWQQERQQIRQQLGLPDDSNNGYHREPFATDVSEGKNNPIYNAHSYHTKVPHRAIMRYILHYTDPGDIVLDGFCGTGMTGVAAQFCGDRREVSDLGYHVSQNGVITAENGEKTQLGVRRAVLSDLSPSATFIAYNYNAPTNIQAFEPAARLLLEDAEKEVGWMYETLHVDGKTEAKINYTVWSEVFTCPNCGNEVVYFDAAVAPETFRVNAEFKCPSCGADLDKKSLDRTWETDYDPIRQEIHSLVKYRPVLINYQMGNMRLEKRPDPADLAIIDQIANTSIPHWYPAAVMPEGERKGKDGYHLKGITHIHHFYFRRALLAFSGLWNKIDQHLTYEKDVSSFLRFFVQGYCTTFTKMNRYRETAFSQVNQTMSGTLFVGSIVSEVSPRYALQNKLNRLIKLQLPGKFKNTALTCQSTTSLPQLPDNSVDYIFVDPPFGNNLHYSELNFFWESWLRLLTQREPEAVMDKGRNRSLMDYQDLMFQCFDQLFRVLKPGHWMTVEFHNSRNNVWNAIQEAMLRAGFVVADVRTLDKQQETYKQSIQQLVKQDLVISAYKPTVRFEQQFLSHAGTAEGVWNFVRQHLTQVPKVVLGSDGRLETVAERQNYLLFDRMVAYHIQRGIAVPMGAAQFYAGLHQRFTERDDMYFLPEQVSDYDKARLEAVGMEQLSIFVSDEKSALTWLRQQLNAEPQSFQEIQPRFLRELHQARHEAMPDLRVLLEENFLQDEAGRWYVPDPNKAEDLEKLRLRSLLREFEGYKEGRKQIKQFRTEAVRAGFAHAWAERDFQTIVAVAERLPDQVLQEDPDLLMYYDNASLRME